MTQPAWQKRARVLLPECIPPEKSAKSLHDFLLDRVADLRFGKPSPDLTERIWNYVEYCLEPRRAPSVHVDAVDGFIVQCLKDAELRDECARRLSGSLSPALLDLVKSRVPPGTIRSGLKGADPRRRELDASAVPGVEALLDFFGAWPSFHDAEVRSLTLDRAGSHPPVLDARLHVFEWGSETERSGHFKVRKHASVTLRFGGVDLTCLDGFNEQNVLFDLEIAELEDVADEHVRYRVCLRSAYGVSAQFDCARIEVVHVADAAV